MKRILFTCLFLLWASIASGAAIEHVFVQQNTPQTTTSATFVDVTGAAITSGNFTAGKKYLLLVTAQFAVTDTVSTIPQIQIVHGSTAFAESLQEDRNDTANEYATYNWFTVWTAVSAEGVKMQMKSDGAATLQVDQIAMFAMNISDDVTENTDWFFAERADDDGLSTTPVDGGSVTFTPAGASDWLVLAMSRLDPTTTGRFSSELNRSGEASSSTPKTDIFISANPTSLIFLFSRVFSLTAVSNTFKEVSSAATSAHVRRHSRIFALNLNKFKNHASVYTEAATALSTTDYATEIATLSLTPDVQSNTLIGGYWTFVINSSSRQGEFRVQVGGADQPAGQTTDVYQFGPYGGSSLIDVPVNLITVPDLAASAHTIDLDASASNTGASAEHRSLWAFTMELAAAAPTRNRVIVID